MSRRLVLEKSLEQQLKKKLDSEGLVVMKMGYDGWPDRLVLTGNNEHYWVEMKRPGGKLRKAQVIRKRQLEKLGDTVNVIGD